MTGRVLRHRAFACCAWLAVAVLAAPVSGQTPGPLGAFRTLTLTLSSPDREFLPLEPIPLTLALENQTARGVRGHMALEFFLRRVELVIQGEGSTARRVSDLSTRRGVLIDIQPWVIKPGEKRRVEELFNLGLDQVLPQPGRYSLKAVLRGIGRQDEVTSNAVSIVVREPDRFEREAYAHIQSTGVARYIFTPRAQEDLRDQLEEIAERFGDTPYADYANLLIGEYWAGRRDAVSARTYLSRIAGKPSFPLAERAASRLAGLR